MTRHIDRDIDRLIERDRNLLVELTTELIGCRPTYVGPTTGIRRAQSIMAGALREAGMRLVDVPAASNLRHHPLYVGVEEWTDDFAHYEPGVHPLVVARVDVDPALPTLALSGHIDVEPVDEQEWTDPALAGGCLRDGAVFGRGASDMLGSLAAYAVAVRAAVRLGGPRVNLEVHSVPDEELGGNGTLALLAAHPAPDYVLVGEPTSMRICEATLGFHHFVLNVEGRRTHMAESSGADSAIERAAAAITAVAATRQDLANRIRNSPGFAAYGSNPLAIGKVHGGSDAAVPPLACQVEGVAFSAPEMSIGDMRELLATGLRERGTELAEPRLTRMSFPGNPPSADRRLATSLAACLRSTGEQPEWTGFPSPCDLRLYHAFGAAGVVCGPGDLAQAHAPDEHVEVDALIAFAKVITRLILNFTIDNSAEDVTP
ncbi:M20 family metallopeptidase [Micromonospora sp. WMMD737]|uniref:M20 family metallopeptidase n=1 Tax=Micromonospora sp. WMMD737 TaxID=3404113 RepID=UPI003B927070